MKMNVCSFFDSENIARRGRKEIVRNGAVAQGAGLDVSHKTNWPLVKSSFRDIQCILTLFAQLTRPRCGELRVYVGFSAGCGSKRLPRVQKRAGKREKKNSW